MRACIIFEGRCAASFAKVQIRKPPHSRKPNTHRGIHTQRLFVRQFQRRFSMGMM
ncbi:hypothetical protein M529_04045 [Sphingobium ummariense RL-3]|uniref:Uncharacterized protein n=1 Tax=Sphingobium ummariense RL-3 TaxID=1346791 RepID=T0IXB7_9SPHN|nr:hypothetical protein M529_04045 [Sphingobium ummariense RL-3]